MGKLYVFEILAILGIAFVMFVVASVFGDVRRWIANLFNRTRKDQ